MASAKDERIVCIKVHNCDNMQSKCLLLDSVIVMHVIDEKTGMHLKKSERKRAVVSFYENQRDDVDYFLPLMSKPVLISGPQSTLLIWEEEFILNEQYSSFIDSKSSVMLFFEIYDRVRIAGSKHSQGMKAIAWAFLKLVGSYGKINAGSKLRLQLYKPSKELKNNNPSSLEGYELWFKSQRIPMNASLYITIKPYIPFSVEAAMRSLFPIQQEKGSTTFEELFIFIKRCTSEYTAESESAHCDKNTEIIWTRKPGEPCKIPMKKELLLGVINASQIVKFSSNGRLLAVGCGICDRHCLMFYQIPSGEEVHKMLAHNGVIYDIDWSFNDKHILSASSDCTVKLWDSKCWRCRETFVHPSYVYCAKFHPALDNLFASASYDHVIRIWLLERHQLLAELESHKAGVYTLCWNTSGTKLYSADGIGQIKVWRKKQITALDSEMFELEKEIQPEETAGISIQKMVIKAHSMTTTQEETLCLFCSDSVIRILSLNGAFLASYESVESSPDLSKGCCSPCGNLLFSCCYNGNVCVWQKDFCTKFDCDFLYDMNYGATSCIDYHPYEHMLALSFWKERVPVHVYTYGTAADDVEINEICKRIGSLTIKDDQQEESNNPKQRTKLEKQLPVGTYVDVASQTSKMQRASKYRTHNLKEPSLSSSMVWTESEDYKKESLTAIITKSGQFDVISATDDSACPDSNIRSSNDSTGINRSSKRSQRREKLRYLDNASS